MKTPGILILPGLISLAFLFNLTPIQTLPPPPAGNIYDQFIIGAMHNAMDPAPNYIRIDELKMNLWHTYIQGKFDTGQGLFVPVGWDGEEGYDQLFTPDNSYTSVPKEILNTLWNHNNGKHTRSFIQRPKIEWLCYGQRSDYQCEDIAGSDDLWFYSFQSPLHVGTDIPDNQYNGGKMVRYVDKTVYQGAAPPRIVFHLLFTIC